MLSLSALAVAEETVVEDLFIPHMQVTVPFVEWRSGPAKGYPIFHISEKGEWLEVSIRKTEWLKVKDVRGNEGWVSVDDVLSMTDINGEKVSISRPVFDDFSTRRWEAGLLSGQFDSAALNSGYLGYWMTNNISLELWGTFVLGDSADTVVVSVNALHQPFPSWKFSPFFTLGSGMVLINPKATLSDEAKRDEESIHVGIGARYYLSDRYFLRMEVKEYKIFTNRERNEEATEWKIGLSVFF
jgi:uncharacterized protein YgiM (DUF1202 family)